MYKIEWTEYSKEDYEKLDGNQKVFVDNALDKIKIRGMDSGNPLNGALIGCNKLKNKRLGLRVIFSKVKNKIEVIQIVVIGKRSNDDIYNIASIRLK